MGGKDDARKGGEASRRKAGAKGKGKDGGVVKVTLVVSESTDQKLDVWSKRNGMNRSEMADKILSEALRCVVIQIRPELAGEGGRQAVEHDSEGASAA